MTIQQALTELKELEALLHAYGHAIGCLNYDGETVAPRNSAPMRGQTMAYLSGIIHRRITAGGTGEVIDTREVKRIRERSTIQTTAECPRRLVLSCRRRKRNTTRPITLQVARIR